MIVPHSPRRPAICAVGVLQAHRGTRPIRAIGAGLVAEPGPAVITRQKEPSKSRTECHKARHSDPGKRNALPPPRPAPTMRFVSAKAVNEQAAAVLASVRERLIRNRTQLASAIRGYTADSAFPSSRSWRTFPCCLNGYSPTRPCLSWRGKCSRARRRDTPRWKKRLETWMPDSWHGSEPTNTANVSILLRTGAAALSRPGELARIN